MGASVRRIAGLVAALALSAVIVVGCGDDGNGNPGGSNDGGGGGSGDRDSRVVGDWLVDEGRDIFKENWSFKSSGEMILTEFTRVANFWIEATEMDGASVTWRTDSGKLILSHADYPGDDIIWGAYSVTGNTLVLTKRYCDEEYVDGEWIETDVCEEYRDTMTKTNLSNFRNSLGSVRTGDTALRGEGRYEWRMSSGGKIGFDWMCFYENPRRYMNTNILYYEDEALWYTSNNRLHLLFTECAEYVTVRDEWENWEACNAYSIAENVELNYAITTVNGIKTLTLTNPSLGINDVYVWHENENYYHQPKSIYAPKSRPPTPFGTLPRVAR